MAAARGAIWGYEVAAALALAVDARAVPRAVVGAPLVAAIVAPVPRHTHVPLWQ